MLLMLEEQRRLQLSANQVRCRSRKAISPCFQRRMRGGRKAAPYNRIISILRLDIYFFRTTKESSDWVFVPKANEKTKMAPGNCFASSAGQSLLVVVCHTCVWARWLPSQVGAANNRSLFSTKGPSTRGCCFCPSLPPLVGPRIWHVRRAGFHKQPRNLWWTFWKKDSQFRIRPVKSWSGPCSKWQH